MTTARRFTTVLALMVWQGGFTFYAAAVVPIGQRILGSHLAQGLVTQQVTRALNLVGVGALIALASEAWASGSGRRVLRGLWAAMASSLAALFALHSKLDALLGSDPRAGFDAAAFYFWHRVYLWVSTAQWLAALAFLAVSLARWSAPAPSRAA